MSVIKLYNGDCLDFLDILYKQNIKVDGGFTSPPYNLNVKRKCGDIYNKKYNTYNDHMSNEEYIEWQVLFLKKVEKILKANGSFLYNINYGGENNETMWLLLSRIIINTPFTIADQIIWKKSTAIPNNRSKNKITRICENIFVLCRKDEYKTFETNKNIVSVVKKTGQNNYENVYNIIEARNNDGGEITKIHKATFSTDLAEQMLNRYYKKDSLIIDPFMGGGTVGNACKILNMNFFGAELDEMYFKHAERNLLHDR